MNSPPALNQVLRREKQLAAAKELLRKAEADPMITVTPESKQEQ